MMFADPSPEVAISAPAQRFELMQLLGRIVRPHGLMSWLDDGQGHLYLDDNWKTALGVAADVVPSFASWALVHTDDRARIAEAWAGARHRGERFDTLLRIRTRQGHHVRAHVAGQPWSSGTLPLRYVGTCRLVSGGEQTLRHLSAQELKAARALAGLSVGQLAHLSTVSVATIARLEASLNVRRHNQIKIIDALCALGIEMFRDAEGGFYMRLRPAL